MMKKITIGKFWIYIVLTMLASSLITALVTQKMTEEKLYDTIGEGSYHGFVMFFKASATDDMSVIAQKDITNAVITGCHTIDLKPIRLIQCYGTNQQ